jgi:hypothetical protein
VARAAIGLLYRNQKPKLLETHGVAPPQSPNLEEDEEEDW